MGQHGDFSLCCCEFYDLIEKIKRYLLPNQLTTKFIKMEARMLKITKIVRTTTAAPNNSLIGRNIRNTYRPEILKQTGKKNYFANNNTRINTNATSTANAWKTK